MNYDNVRFSGSWWGKALLAGMVGGVAMILYLMIASAILGSGFFTPLNMIAATSSAFRPTPMAFVGSAFILGAFLHMISSAAWGLVLGAGAGVSARLFSSGWAAVLTGVVYGALVWLVMGLIIGPALDPVMGMSPPVNFFVGHLIFGVCASRLLYQWAKGNELTRSTAMRTSGVGGDFGLRPT